MSVCGTEVSKGFLLAISVGRHNVFDLGSGDGFSKLTEG